MSLAIATGTQPAGWFTEPDETILTAIELLAEAAERYG